ncbi:protein LURP-one-related 5-like [Miscanthus floridulus]|uniref:protein LURP-one-related 5-like n=1 Tax=Miscanthus floridulus TaxID=154761 RepID=UPI003457A883
MAAASQRAFVKMSEDSTVPTPCRQFFKRSIMARDFCRRPAAVRALPPTSIYPWDGAAQGQKPVFSARRSSILGAAAVLVDLIAPGVVAGEFRVDGSFPRRCCRVVASAKAWAAGDGKDKEEKEEEEDVVVAEARRKVDEDANVMMGRDVFVLWVRAGFDAAFAMGIVLVLDRITGDDIDGDLGEELLEAATSPE